MSNICWAGSECQRLQREGKVDSRNCAYSDWTSVIRKRHIDQLLASENNRDFQPVTYIPALANESNAAGETPVDMQDQQETQEPNQEMDEEEQPCPEQRYPSRIRQEPIRLGHDS